MSIPLELIDQVCLYVPLDDLCRVARSSSVLCAVAQRFLYQDVSIDSRSLALTLTLANKPHLARHVRAFTIALAPGATLLPAYFRALTTAISHMHEIVSLSIALPERLSRVLLTHQGTVFPSLRRLQASFALDPHLIQFLGKAPGLRSLTLDQTIHVHNTEIPSSLLPNLTSFSGSSHAAQTLVPGRPVSTIFLTSGDLTLEVVSDLAKSSAPIATLDGTTTLLPLPILESLSASMPELENIRLTTTYNLWDEFFSTPFIQNIKNALVAMDNLKSANVSGMLWKWLNKDGRVLTNEPHLPSQLFDHNDDSEWTYDNHNTYYHN